MSNLTVANTILEQLGGRRFVVFTGARNLTGSDDSLSFTLPTGKCRNGINAVEVKLLPSDTYRVRFYRVGDRRTGYKHTDKSVHEDIYCDQLVEIFERETGLYTHL